MKKLLTIIGARPQIIKAAALNRAIESGFSEQVKEVLVDTGQHYDHAMSAAFFEELGIPAPIHRLGIGSAGHGEQTGRMLRELERILQKEKPDVVVVYGDTNSTLAGALAASKLHIPVAHIEAGLRSFNKKMPEEVNRIMADHVSTFLFSPTTAGLNNLYNEGFPQLQEARSRGAASADNPYVFHCGDVMFDNSLFYSSRTKAQETIFSEHDITRDNFVLATIHRPQNTDDMVVLARILSTLHEISATGNVEIVLPLHPRTAKMIGQSKDAAIDRMLADPRIRIIGPVGFLEMLLLEKNAQLIITDSGGVQKEAYFMQKPCIILREETEWTEIVENGCAMLAGSDPLAIKNAYEHFKRHRPVHFPSIFGDGNAATSICRSILDQLN